MGIHKYLSFVIRRPSSASKVPKKLLFKCCFTFFRETSSGIGFEHDQQHHHRNHHEKKHFWRFPQMILKPISKVINNRRNVKNYCYYIRSNISLCACRWFFFCFVFILRQRAAANKKAIINHFIYLATYAHENR